MTKVYGFTGSRQGITDPQMMALCTLLHDGIDSSGSYFHHGDCVGADATADRLARTYGYKTVLHPAGDVPDSLRAWSLGSTLSYAARPALERNKNIVRACDELIACPSTMVERLRSGTWATVRAARKMNKPIILIRPDGSVAYL